MQTLIVPKNPDILQNETSFQFDGICSVISYVNSRVSEIFC